jgi:hypothetical protein
LNDSRREYVITHSQRSVYFGRCEGSGHVSLSQRAGAPGRL